MEEVNITELESRYFSDLFACCDIEKTGKVPILKATEMFRSSNISDDILKNVRFSSSRLFLSIIYLNVMQTCTNYYLNNMGKEISMGLIHLDILIIADYVIG